jgi:hypothetical protein
LPRAASWQNFRKPANILWRLDKHAHLVAIILPINSGGVRSRANDTTADLICDPKFAGAHGTLLCVVSSCKATVLHKPKVWSAAPSPR